MKRTSTSLADTRICRQKLARDKMIEETIILAGVKVTLSRPTTNTNPTGVTFLLPGAMIPPSEYKTTRDVLVDERNQWVLSFYINVVWPPCDNHRAQVNKVGRIFAAFRALHPEVAPDHRYNVVGHSVGAKVALVLATLDDGANVATCVALDPVDQAPPEFTKEEEDGGGSSTNLAIPYTTRGVTIMTLTDGGRGIAAQHNAGAIHASNAKSTVLVRHEAAGHLAYTDNGGGAIARMVIPDVGTLEGNEAARSGAHELIRKLIS